MARKYSGKVIYFDTGNSFSPKRVAQFLSQSSDPANTEVKISIFEIVVLLALSVGPLI